MMIGAVIIAIVAVALIVTLAGIYNQYSVTFSRKYKNNRPEPDLSNFSARSFEEKRGTLDR